MRRQRRRRTQSYRFFYITGSLIIVLAITLVILYRMYNKKLNSISEDMLSQESIIGLVPNINQEEDDDNTASASFELSKAIEEVKENLDTTREEGTKEVVPEENEAISVEEKVENTQEEKEIPKKELAFSYPVEGKIAKEFAMEKLVYSKTLEEWIVHQGIDIKADRTTVVKAAEEGTVVAIKNDPRYGLTVIIEHIDGYKTVYSNLLTTEFVTEDEHVEKGQSIGTVGNSAAFEIADEPHLHFEMLKEGEYVDPILYLK